MLERDLDHPRLSPFSHPPEVVGEFEQLRARIQQEIAAQPVPRPPPTPAWAVLPLGVPQFIDGHPVRGALFGVSRRRLAVGAPVEQAEAENRLVGIIADGVSPPPSLAKSRGPYVPLCRRRKRRNTLYPAAPSAPGPAAHGSATTRASRYASPGSISVQKCAPVALEVAEAIRILIPCLSRHTSCCQLPVQPIIHTTPPPDAPTRREKAGIWRFDGRPPLGLAWA